MDGNASQGQSNITIGDDSTIYAKGKGYGANAVQAGYLSYTGFNGVGTKQGSSGQISVGDKATIWTEGDESFAVYGIHADSTLMLAKMPRSVLRAIRLRLSAAAILLKYMILLLPAAKSLLMKGQKSKLWGISHMV